MDIELLGKVVQRVETMTGIKMLLVFSVASLNLSVAEEHIRADQLVENAQLSSCLLKKVGKSRLLLEKRLVNSKLLSV